MKKESFITSGPGRFVYLHKKNNDDNTVWLVFRFFKIHILAVVEDEMELEWRVEISELYIRGSILSVLHKTICCDP